MRATVGGEPKVCLDLFSGLGGFSAAFESDPEWAVYRVDIEAEFDPDLVADIQTLTPRDLLEVIGLDREAIELLVVLASPPCTYFSPAGNHDAWDFTEKRPLTPGARNAVALAFHAVGLIRALAPEYWFLENPQGRLRWFLGQPTGRVTYCQYGRPYMKRTDLWGEHPPMPYRSCRPGRPCHQSNVEHDGRAATHGLGATAAERAKVPAELSQAIHDAIEEAHRNPPPTQATLPANGNQLAGGSR